MSRCDRTRRASSAWLLLGVTALAGTTALAACSKSETPGAKAEGRVPGVAVVVAQVTARDVPVRVRAIGNVQALTHGRREVAADQRSAHDRALPRGPGRRKGDLLFTIDRRPLQAALQQAEANLSQARAQLRQAEAAVVRDRAQLENAASRTAATRSSSSRDSWPASSTTRSTRASSRWAPRFRPTRRPSRTPGGRSSSRMRRRWRARVFSSSTRRSARPSTAAPVASWSSPGISSRPTTCPCSSSIAVRPIYVAFAVPERALAEIRRYMAVGALDVEVQPQGVSAPARGPVTFVDNTVDATTGTIQLKATVPNADARCGRASSSASC